MCVQFDDVVCCSHRSVVVSGCVSSLMMLCVVATGAWWCQDVCPV